jgi:hypothetical protein
MDYQKHYLKRIYVRFYVNNIGNNCIPMRALRALY